MSSFVLLKALSLRKSPLILSISLRIVLLIPINKPLPVPMPTNGARP